MPCMQLRRGLLLISLRLSALKDSVSTCQPEWEDVPYPLGKQMDMQIKKKDKLGPQDLLAEPWAAQYDRLWL